MKKIKNLTVTQTYIVQLTDVEVPDSVYESLMEKDEYDSNEFLEGNDALAMDWLETNIEQNDATDWRFEIDNITE